MLLCDRYDAIRSKRPYKAAMSHEEALRVILDGDERSRPEQFDPDVLSAFRRYNGRFAEAYDANALLH